MRKAHVYRPRGQCALLFAERGDEVVLSGPAGTGKSRACLEKLHFACLGTPGTRALIVRKTRESLGSSALVTWREHVAKEALETGDVYFYGGSAEEPAQYRYSNGSSVVVGGMDKPTKIMSTEYDLIYVQEATELTEEDWDALTTRLRNGRLSFQQLLADCNPSFPRHWLKQRSDRNTTRMINTLHEDNPVLVKEDGSFTKVGRAYLKKLDNLTGVRKLRLRYGLWAAAEGIIYENWNPDVHVIDPFLIPDSWPRFWSIDFGYTNPFVLQCWAQDRDGRLYLYREIYETKKLVEDHARTILDIVAPRLGDVALLDEKDRENLPRVWKEPRPRAVICDHDAEGRATFEKHSGLSTVNAHKAVTEGIQAFEERLDVQDDGLPRIFFLRNALVKRDQNLIDAKKPTCTIEEIPGYAWDDSARIGLKETPRKEDDHGCDGGRYQVAYHDLKGKARIRIMNL